MNILYKEELARPKYSCTKKTYDYIIEQGNELNGEYTDEVLFHCYWSGELNETHLLSIMSCYYHNIKNYANRKIILWIDGPEDKNKYYMKINEIVDIKKFDMDELLKDTQFHKTQWNYHHDKNVITEKSNLVRLLLLYVYGGVWFDLDVLFLKNFSPLLSEYENEVCLYAWQPYNYTNRRKKWVTNYPNNAIIICPQKNSKKLNDAILYINNLKRGFGFQRGRITYDLPIDFLVLPCYWFNPQWMGCNPDITFNKNQSWSNPFLETHKLYNFDNFYKGAFAYHWFSSNRKRLNKNNSTMVQFYDFFEKGVNLK